MKRRNCCKVINEMILLIPDEKTEFHKDLKWNFEDAKYKAPEDNLQWIRTQETLIKHIPYPKEDWEFKVLSVFTTNPIDKIKEYLKTTSPDQ